MATVSRRVFPACTERAARRSGNTEVVSLAPPNIEAAEMRSFKETLDSMNDAELGAKFRDRYERLMEAYAMGLSDEPPSVQYNADNAILRAHRVAKDAQGNGSGLGARKLEPTDRAEDDTNPSGANPPRAPEREGANVARDRRLAADQTREELAIRNSGSADVEGQLALLRARRADPAAVRDMNAAIPGLDRLR